MDGETKAAFTQDEVANRHGICRASLYNLWKIGKGPRYITIPGRRRVTREQELDWHRDLERVQQDAA
jgi:hypothetical protein